MATSERLAHIWRISSTVKMGHQCRDINMIEPAAAVDFKVMKSENRDVYGGWKTKVENNAFMLIAWCWFELILAV
jgi:hypothetical protein